METYTLVFYSLIQATNVKAYSCLFLGLDTFRKLCNVNAPLLQKQDLIFSKKNEETFQKIGMCNCFFKSSLNHPAFFLRYSVPVAATK